MESNCFLHILHKKVDGEIFKVDARIAYVLVIQISNFSNLF